MNDLLILIGFLAGALAGWAALWYRSRETMVYAREQMNREIRHWQAETERYRAVAQRLTQEKKAWTAGLKQGRDDVMSLVPMLMAAQQAAHEDEQANHGGEPEHH